MLLISMIALFALFLLLGVGILPSKSLFTSISSDVRNGDYESVYDVGTDEEGVCGYYLGPSTIPSAGRGIIAGQAFNEEDVLEEGITLTVRSSYLRHWQLNNYVYELDDDHSMLIFGVSMLFNHHPVVARVNSKFLWSDYEVTSISEQSEAHSTYTKVTYFANASIGIGEEIFTSYGDNDWFSARNITLMTENDEYKENATTVNCSNNDSEQGVCALSANTTTFDLEYLNKNAHCLTDIYVSDSYLSMAGKGLFAKKSFSKGEVVSISPVLFLPKNEVITASEDSVLLNYCIASEYSSIALVPLGLGAIANHQMTKYANMQIEWLQDSSDPEAFQKKLNRSVDDLLTAKYAEFDIVYRAVRDIDAHEELTISYGEEWVNSWATYLSYLLQWHISNSTLSSFVATEENANPPTLPPRPKFRYPIQPPEGFFPKNWLSNDMMYF